MEKNILITGSTGFLGWYLVKRFLEDDETRLILLVRPRENHSAKHRIKKLFKRYYNNEEEYNKIKSRLEIIDGSIQFPNLGLHNKLTEKLSKQVTHIFHSAALCDFNVPYPKIKEVNVEGTRNILNFALRCKKNPSFESVNHISTIAVSGTYQLKFYEDFLDVGQDFNNTYEKSKFEAEKLIHKYRKRGLNANIFRPSIIVGDSKDGYASNFKVIYQPIHILSLGIYKRIPARGSIKYNITPVDFLSDAIYRIHTKGRPYNQTFHMTNTHEVTGDFIFETASRFFGYPDTERVPLEEFDIKKLKGFRKLLLSPYIPYLNHNYISYDNKSAQDVLEKTSFQWPKIDKKFLYTLFDFCQKTQFITPQNRAIL